MINNNTNSNENKNEIDIHPKTTRAVSFGRSIGSNELEGVIIRVTNAAVNEIKIAAYFLDDKFMCP